MLKTLWNGRSGLYANQNRLDAISNNIANVNTNGYKRMDVAFEDIFYENMNRRGLPVTDGENTELKLGSSSKADLIVRNYKDGNLIETGREEDLAISGEGYFKLMDENGNAFYTRDGVFSVDKDGNLVHSSGLKLDIENFQPKELKKPMYVNENGSIVSDGKSIGKINLYDFKDRDSMISAGQNLFKTDSESMKADGSIMQGYIESSNVDIAKELTDMMITQRAYELNSRSVKAADEMWGMANNLRSR